MPAFAASLDPVYDKAIARNFNASPTTNLAAGTAVTDDLMNAICAKGDVIAARRLCTLTEKNPHLAAAQAAQQIIAMHSIEAASRT